MKNISLFCLSLNPAHLNKIKNLGFLPVGLGNSNFSNEWLRDNTNENINQLTKSNVYFKLENFQWTGSFKLRGAINKISLLSS